MRAFNGDILILDNFWVSFAVDQLVFFLIRAADMSEMNTSRTEATHGQSREGKVAAKPTPGLIPQASKLPSADTGKKRGEVPISPALRPAGDAGQDLGIGKQVKAT